MKNEKITLGDDGISLRTSERRPHTIIRYLQVSDGQLTKSKESVRTHCFFSSTQQEKH